jgi:hypothetical protein
MNAPARPARRIPLKAALILALCTLVVGAVLATMALRAWQARQDPLPDAVMHVMDHQVDQLRASIAASRCTATDAVPRLQSLRALANDLEPAFPGLASDDRFVGHASRLRATLDEALAHPPTDCSGLDRTVAQIGQSCSGCHQDFR